MTKDRWMLQWMMWNMMLKWQLHTNYGQDCIWIATDKRITWTRGWYAFNQFITFIISSMETVRKFEWGSCRDGNAGKLEYGWYINPLCDYSFATYMQSKQIIGGEYRAWDNRQLGDGIPPESLYDSLVRHMEVLKLLIKWNNVYERKDGDWVTHLDVDAETPFACNVEQKTIINELNAIRFNSEALKLYHLKSIDLNRLKHQ